MATVVHDPEYLKWVQYSFNRLLSAWIITDGFDSDYYRTCVKAFKTLARAQIKNDKFDEDAHARLISINNIGQNQATRVYLNWAQTALKEALFFKGEPNGVLTEQTKNAVKDFQSSVNHKHIDGVIGPKTERDLIKRIPSLMIPGFYMGGYKPPDPVGGVDDIMENSSDPNAIPILIENWVRTYYREFEENGCIFLSKFKNDAIKGMLKKLMSADGSGLIYTNNYEYLNASDVANYDLSKPLSSIKADALKVLREEVGKFSPNATAAYRYFQFKDSIENLYLRIDNGINKIYELKTLASGTRAGVYDVLETWHEELYANKTSLISCFKEPPDSELFPPPPPPDNCE